MGSIVIPHKMPEEYTCVPWTIRFLINQPIRQIWKEAKWHWLDDGGMDIDGAREVFKYFGYQFGRKKNNYIFRDKSKRERLVLFELLEKLTRYGGDRAFYIQAGNHSVGWKAGKFYDVDAKSKGVEYGPPRKGIVNPYVSMRKEVLFVYEVIKI